MATASKTIGVAILALAISAGAQTATIQSGKTVRRSHVVDDSLQRGEAALEKKDYAGAEQALRQAAESDPQSYRAWYDLGYVYSATNRQQDAADAYRKSIAAKPDLFESNLNLGLLLAQTGDPSAEKYLHAATTLKPASDASENMARAWLGLAQFLRKSDPARALAAYAKVQQLRPNDPEPHLSSAQIAATAKDFATAEKEYAAAQRLDPKSIEAAAGLANLYLETKRLEDAERAVRQYLSLAEQGGPSAQIARAHTQLGRVLLQLHRRDEAIAEFEKALELAPGDQNAAQQLAWMYLQDKQYLNAEKQFRTLLQASPKDADLHHGLGSCLLQQKKFDEAEKELIMAVQLKPSMGEAYGDLAAAASENKHYVLALKALDARAKLLPENPGTLFVRATSLDHLGDKVNASNSYRDFLAASNGRFPDQEWQARHRLIAIDPKAKK